MDALAKVCPKCGRRYDTAAAFCQKDGSRLQLTDEEPDPYIGTTLLDQFKIEEKIGAGGMGSVYRARQTTLHRDVAIKILHPELADNRDAVRRFKREARVCTALDHPNVVRVFLFGQLPDGSLYIVMEFLKGRSLLEVLQRDGALPVHRALHISAQICDGVGEAHAAGVVHRDIKPENIVLVTKSRDADFVKVLDFGIARVLWGDDQTQATQSGLVFGTARYISPEGAAGEATDARSDVYSLGVLTYQLLCGETPFDATSPVAMLMKHIHSSPPHLLSNERAKHVPEPIADVVMRALAKNPEGRFEEAHAFSDALRVAAEGSGFEIDARRRASLTPSSQPELPAISSKPISIPAELNVPISRMRDDSTEKVQKSETLSAAPSPFDENDDVSIPGLARPFHKNAPSRSKGGAWRLVILAFAVGALLVGGGFAVQGWLRDSPRAPAVDIDDLVSRARDALAHGRYDEPRARSVLGLTERILAHDRRNREALRLRDEAADRLADEAEAQAERGERDEARATYRRALVLRPGDDALEAAIASLDVPVEPAIPAGIHTRPERVVEDAETTFVAVLEPGVQIGARARPRFVLKRTNQRLAIVDATPSADGRSFEATHRIATPGSYRIFFRIGDGPSRIELSADLEVHRSGERPPRNNNPPPVTTQGSAWSPPSLAPAWTSTPMPQEAPPDPPREPDPPPMPEPWTGGGSVL
jgi:eukaryotic-like serine/threonine-protein kinase